MYQSILLLLLLLFAIDFLRELCGLYYCEYAKKVKFKEKFLDRIASHSALISFLEFRIKWSRCLFEILSDWRKFFMNGQDKLTHSWRKNLFHSSLIHSYILPRNALTCRKIFSLLVTKVVCYPLQNFATSDEQILRNQFCNE